MRNPKWTRDELILALDLYFRCSPSKTYKDRPEIIILSDVLNALIRKKQNMTISEILTVFI